MNEDSYAKVLVSFYEKNVEKRFTSCERDLFLYLLCVWAKSKQVTPFSCSTSLTERDLSLPRKTIIQCRRRLCERGVITFHEGKGKNNNPYYYFSEVTEKVTEKVTVKVTEKVTVTKEEIPPTPPKEENNIYNNKENNSNELLKKDKLSSTERKKEVHTDYPALMNYFNDLLGSCLPKVKRIDGARKSAVDARVKEYGKGKVVEALDIVSKSDFLMGRKTGWKCSFDWIFKKSNFEKILEGNYDNGASNNQAGGQHRTDPGTTQNQFSNYLRENFGFDGTAEEFEEWFNKEPYGS